MSFPISFQARITQIVASGSNKVCGLQAVAGAISWLKRRFQSDQGHSDSLSASPSGVRVPRGLPLLRLMRSSVRLARLAALVLVLTAIGFLPDSRAANLVSNFDQAGFTDTAFSFDNDIAQTFTTGDFSHGYTLDSIALQLDPKDPGDYTVKLYKANSSGKPDFGEEVATLTKPVNFVQLIDEFSVPGAGVHLAAETDYVLVFDFPSDAEGSGTAKSIPFDAEDTGAFSGWGIRDNGWYRANNTTGDWTSSSSSVQIRVKGNLASIPATGKPAISGTGKVGELLTAAQGDIADENGLTNVAFSYQWIRVDSGTETEIGGATSSTYMLAVADAGKKVKVKLSFTDDAGHSESLTSDAFPPNTFIEHERANIDATGAPEISGPAGITRVGDVLTAAQGDIADGNGLTNATFSYQWIRVDSGTETEIGGATSSTYTLVSDDLGKKVKVKLSFADDDGHNESRTSEAHPSSTTIEQTANSPATGSPSIAGTARVAGVLTASQGTIADGNNLTNATFSYQWIRVDGMTETEISGANSSTYTLVAGDLGKKVKVTLSFTDGHGYSESRPSAAYPSSTTIEHALADNTAPTSADMPVTATEDVDYTFRVTDFRFMDGNSGDRLESVKVISLPAIGKGILNLDGRRLLAGDLPKAVARADIDAERLTYTPPADAYGSAYATFKFKVNDGDVDSTAEYTTTIDVTGVNDAPTVANEIADQPATVGSNFSYAFPANAFSDPDGDTLSYGALTANDLALPSWLTFTAGTRTFSGTPQGGDAGTVSVKVTANDSNEESVSDSFDITVRASANTAPAKVTGVTVTNQTGRLQVNWTVISGADGYRLEWKSGTQDYGTSRQILETDGTTAGRVIYPLYGGTAYTVRVTAFENNSNGPPSYGPPSDTAEGTPTKVTVQIYGVFGFNSETRAARNTQFAGQMQLWVDLMGTTGAYKARGIERSNLAVVNGTVTAAMLNGTRATYWIDMHDPVGGNELDITFRADAIEQGNNVTSVASRFGGLNYTTGAPFTITMTTLATEPVTGDFTVTVTFSEAVLTYTGGELLTAGAWPGRLDLLRRKLVVHGGTLRSQSEISGPFLTRDVRIRPDQNDCGQLTITADAGEFAPHPDLNGGRSNRRTVFEIDVETNSACEPQNAAPEARNGDVTAQEDMPYIFSATEFNFSDRDGDALASVKVVTLPAKGTLTLDDMDIVATPKTVPKDKLDGGKLVYTPPANANGNDYATFKFKVNDGAADSTEYTMTINVTAVNDPPETSDGEVTQEEDTGHPFSASEFDFSDLDGDALASVKVVTLPANGTLALDGAAIVALPQTVLQDKLGELVYTPPRNANGDDYTTFTFRVNDGAADSTEYTMTINVRALNDPPVGVPSICCIPGVGKTLEASTNAIDDPDGLSNSIVWSYKWYRVDADGISNQTVIDGETASTYTLVVDDVDKRIKVQVTYEDEGGTNEEAISGAFPDPGTIMAIATNSSPNALESDVTTVEDEKHTFSAADFNFEDADMDILVSVTLVELLADGAPTFEGALTFDDAVIASGDLPKSVTKAELDAGKLVYTPPENANGDRYASFAFRVSDGNLDSNSAPAMIINVTAVNDRPKGARAGVTIEGGRLYTFTAADFPFTDVDGDMLASVKVVDLPVDGDLILNDAVIASGDLPKSVTKAELDDGKLMYRPPENASGENFASFEFKVNDGTDELTSDSMDSYAMNINVTAAPRAAIEPGAQNEPASGRPVISGTPRVGEVLTVSTNATTDGNGLSNVNWSYQWIRVDVGGSSNQTNIVGATTGTYTLVADDEGKRIKVKVTFQDDDGNDEELTSNAYPSDGVIAPRSTFAFGRELKAWLARFERTVTEQVLDAVEGRLRAAPAPGAEVSLAGEHIEWQAPDPEAGEDAAREELAWRDEKARQEAARLADWLNGETDPEEARRRRSRAVAQRDLLTGSSFALTGETADKDSVSLWGRGAVSRFDGREGDLILDGEVVTGMLGADWTRDRWTAGLILSHSKGEGGWSAGDGASRSGPAGRVEATLTGLFPWARHAVSDRLEAWGAVGYGAGELSVVPKKPGTDEDRAAIRADLDLKMAAAGLRGTMLDGGGYGQTLTAKTDAMVVQTASGRGKGAGDGTMEPTGATVTRLRLGVEASDPMQLGGGATLTPGLEVGLRHDGGDAETGFGLDLGGGLALSDPGRGLEAEIRAGGLLSHEAEGFRERGFSGSLAWRQKPFSDRGATLTLTQTVGGASSGGADAFLSRTTLDGLAANDNGGNDDLKSHRLELKLGYGFSAFDHRFTWTPELGAGLSDTGRDYSLGWRLLRGGFGAPDGGSFELSFEARRRESANDDTPPGHGGGLRLTARW